MLRLMLLAWLKFQLHSTKVQLCTSMMQEGGMSCRALSTIADHGHSGSLHGLMKIRKRRRITHCSGRIGLIILELA